MKNLGLHNQGSVFYINATEKLESCICLKVEGIEPCTHWYYRRIFKVYPSALLFAQGVYRSGGGGGAKHSRVYLTL